MSSCCRVQRVGATFHTARATYTSACDDRGFEINTMHIGRATDRHTRFRSRRCQRKLAAARRLCASRSDDGVRPSVHWNTLGNLGGTIAALGIGLLVDRHGWTVPFLLSSLVPCGCVTCDSHRPQTVGSLRLGSPCACPERLTTCIPPTEARKKKSIAF